MKLPRDLTGVGLIGKCDVVEFWPDGTVYPVDYKHGARKQWLNDDLQPAAGGTTQLQSRVQFGS